MQEDHPKHNSKQGRRWTMNEEDEEAENEVSENNERICAVMFSGVLWDFLLSGKGDEQTNKQKLLTEQKREYSTKVATAISLRTEQQQQ